MQNRIISTYNRYEIIYNLVFLRSLPHPGYLQYISICLTATVQPQELGAGVKQPWGMGPDYSLENPTAEIFLGFAMQRAGQEKKKATSGLHSSEK